MKKISVVFLLILYLPILVFSQSIKNQNVLSEYVSRVWTATDGLPGNTITDIIQDKNGYIYLGTYDGLVRFDGVDFYVINKSTVPEFNVVSARCIFEDSKGCLWVGSNDDGLVKVSDDGIKVLTINDGLPSNSVRDIVEDKHGNIWIGTSSGVVFINNRNEIVAPFGSTETELFVSDLYCDTANRIWIACSNSKGIYIYSAGSFEKLHGYPILANSLVSYITQDSTGAFWIGLVSGGVVRIKDGEIFSLDETQNMITDTINSIFVDSTDAVWFATEKGVVLLKYGELYFYTEENGLTDNNVEKIIEDREGNIWLATDRGGVEKMSLGKFRTVNISSSVNCIAEDYAGYVWLGTDNGLLCYYKGKYVENELTKMCKNIRIRHIEEISDNSLLVCAYSKYGLIKKDVNGNINYWNNDKGLVGDRTRVAIESSDKKIYVGTTTGLSILNTDNSMINLTRSEGLCNEYVMCLYEDAEGAIWIGTDGGGISVYKDNQFVKSYNTNNGLAGNVIFKIIQDKKGLYWICTGSGISRFDGNNFTTFNSQSGIGTDSVFQILVDYTDTVWMTSNQGIFSVPLSSFDEYANDNSKKINPKFFTKNDGLLSDGVTSTSLSMCDSLGRLWFTLIDGFAIYDPLKSKSNKIPPLVHIENVIVDGITVPLTEKIILEPGTKRIEIKYTGLSFVSSEMVKFKYRLSDFEKNYSNLTTSRIVSYTNLKPGKYEFEIFAQNADQLWCENPAKIIIEQKPYFYQMTLFWILFSIVFCGIVALLIIIKYKKYKINQLQLETMITMKTVDLEIEKDRADSLLLNILPDHIAQDLKEDRNKRIAEKFDCVSVLFADLVGFTKIASTVDPNDLVNSLNDLFSRFDDRVVLMGIEKIKTIGDCYMAISGIRDKSENHAHKIIEFARGLLQDVKEFNKTSKYKFDIRIGINSGEVVAGVIGKIKFIYDVWGDTVNIASRMETLSKPGYIHVSEHTYELTKNLVAYTEVETQNVKGKGEMKTYFVQL